MRIISFPDTGLEFKEGNGYLWIVFCWRVNLEGVTETDPGLYDVDMAGEAGPVVVYLPENSREEAEKFVQDHILNDPNDPWSVTAVSVYEMLETLQQQLYYGQQIDAIVDKVLRRK